MMQALADTRLRAAVLALFLLQYGCSVLPPSQPLPPRHTARAVALAVSEQAPVLDLEPATGGKLAGAAKGAGLGAAVTVGTCAVLYGLSSPSPDGQLLLTVVCAIYLVATTLGGAIGGAVQARPGVETREAQRAIAQAAGAAAPAAQLRSALAGLAARHPERALHLLPAEVSPTDIVRLEALSAEGVDALIRIEISEIALVGGGIDPPLALRVTAKARRLALPGGAILDEGIYRTERPTRKYSVWAASEAAALRAELRRALDDIAAQLVDSLPPTR